jgi:hypothetical protein
MSLKDFGISKKDFKNNLPKLVKYAYGDISCYLSPRPITAEQCAMVMTYAYEGKDVDF